jgi:ribosomal protein RSM22 (predicted rRNA methylase)
MQLPSGLRHILEIFANDFPRSALERASIDISERYRRLNKTDPVLAIESASEAMAYGATRLPATYCSASKALESLKKGMPDFFPVSVLDAGAGPATALFAAIEHWPDISNTTLIEPNPHLLSLGKKLLSASYPNVNPVWEQAEITVAATLNKQYDLVLCGYVLNEIEQEKGKNIVLDTVKKLWNATSGALVIIEPGTPASYDNLMRVRNWLIADNAYIVAPCTHSKPCPLSEKKSQKWCHFSVRVERSKLHRQVKKDADLPYEDEKFSYIIAAKKQALIPSFRLIGNPRGSRMIEVDVCTSSGEEKHMNIGKSSSHHKAFRKAQWGDGI